MTDQPPGVEVTVQAFLDTVATNETPTLHELDFEPARENLRNLQSRPVTAPPASIEDRVFPVGPTGSVGVRIVRPHGSNGDDPVILYLHGGGWMMGGKDTHDRLLRELAAGAGASIIFVDYTLAPEARYPVQNEQAYAVLRYIVQNATELKLDPYRIAIAGDCAGGNIAAAVTLLAKQRRGPEIVFQLLFYPILGDVSDTGSYQKSKDGPWLTRRAISGLLDRLFPDPASRREITAFPLQASVLQLNDLPEALVIVANNDVVRDQGESYVGKLVQAGVRATSTR